MRIYKGRKKGICFETYQSFSSFRKLIPTRKWKLSVDWERKTRDILIYFAFRYHLETWPRKGRIAIGWSSCYSFKFSSRFFSSFFFFFFRSLANERIGEVEPFRSGVESFLFFSFFFLFSFLFTFFANSSFFPRLSLRLLGRIQTIAPSYFNGRNNDWTLW